VADPSVTDVARCTRTRSPPRRSEVEDPDMATVKQTLCH
jgi:hypothetical protein